MPQPTKELLQNYYLIDKLSISDISRLFGSHNPTIRKLLLKYEIPLRTHKETCQIVNSKKRNLIPTQEQLTSLYKIHTFKELQNIFGVGQDTLYLWFAKYGISTRSLSDSCSLGKQKQHLDKQIEKDIIVDLYNEVKNLPVLADRLGISYSHLKTLLIRYDLKLYSFRSKAELELFEYVNDGTYQANVRTVIPPYELDIYSETNKLAIEYCGLYWHSEYYGEKSRQYHKSKWDICNKSGIELITIFETDDKIKVQSLLNRKLNKVSRVYARQTQIIKLTSKQANEFHCAHHLHNSVPSSINYGLIYKNELLMVVSFGKSRFNKKYEYECTRMSSHSNVKVLGGASKLFKHFLSTVDSCITYADLRFGGGSVYLHCGFEHSGFSEPNYWYFNKNNPTKLHSRVAFQKHKLPKIFGEVDMTLTEYEIMKQHGWDRIWDCGSAIYTYKKRGAEAPL
jgi:transposase